MSKNKKAKKDKDADIRNKEGDVKKDSNSPSGYSIYKFGFWVPLVVQSQKKKKVNKDSAEYLAKMKEKQEKEHIEQMMTMNNEMHDYISKRKELLVLESGYGYSIVIVKVKLKIQKNIEKGAGFQPYESVNEKELHTVTMLRWGTPSQWGSAAKILIQSDVDMAHVVNSFDVDQFIKGKLGNE
jgi:hypothetical protein